MKVTVMTMVMIAETVVTVNEKHVSELLIDDAI
jgi:hypothetical protein